jgi:transcriptional regulator with XRE-family HTH domain
MCERLRLAREARGLELSVLEERTRVRQHLLSSLEAGRFEELPAGLYARSVVRAYAQAVGLNPDEILAELIPLLPSVEDPLDGLARVRGVEREPPKPVAAHSGVGEPEAPPRRIAVATALDSSILAAIDLGLLASSAAFCGVTIEQLLEFALPAMLMLWGLIAGLYFLLLGGLAGATPGTWLVGLPPLAPDRGPIHVSRAGRRACDLALRESSLLIEALFVAGRSAKTIDPKLTALECGRQVE